MLRECPLSATEQPAWHTRRPKQELSRGSRGNLLTCEGAGLDWVEANASGVERGVRADYSDCISGACFASRRIDSISAGDILSESRRRGYGAERRDRATGVSVDLSSSEILILNCKEVLLRTFFLQTTFTQIDPKAEFHGCCPFE